MNNREKMHKILDLTLDIAERRVGENGYPEITMEVTNFPQILRISCMENGFDHGKGFDKYDGYDFDSEKLDDAIAYLEFVLEKATTYIQEVDK